MNTKPDNKIIISLIILVTLAVGVLAFLSGRLANNQKTTSH